MEINRNKQKRNLSMRLKNKGLARKTSTTSDTNRRQSALEKERALLEGFTIYGIASIPGSSRLKLRNDALERWLSQNYHGDMKWMESEKRKNIESLLEGAKRVFSVGFCY